MDHRRLHLLSVIGGCALDCSKRREGMGASGLFFCDPNTGNCEPCIDICHPSRGTLDECRDQISCKDLWNMSASTALDGDATMAPTATAAAAAAVSSDHTLATVTPILVVFCILVLTLLAIVVFRRRRNRRARVENERTEPLVIYKHPIPVSTEEQEREHLSSAANENCTDIDVIPEVDGGHSPLISG